MKKPKISVCIPAHNAELWLAESIQSIVDQTFDHWEIIVVNDGSSDSTSLIANHFVRLLGEKIHIYEQPNSGIASARNEANKIAQGEIICVQDADDISHKDRLKNTWKYFQRHKNVDLVYGSCQYINAIGKPFHMVPAEPFDPVRIRKENWIQHPTVAYRRVSVLEVPYRNECRVLDDWFLYLDFHRAGKKISHIEDVLSFYRVLKTSVSRAKEKAEEVAGMKKKFLEEACEDSRPVGV